MKRMTAVLRHRGPDGSGVYVDDRVGLGHARLSIIDLSGGSQPIHNEDETLWIVYNGEIFNYPELRQGLVSRGHRFSTATDTEVILHLYEERGADCLHELNGQFAFAVWDVRKKELFLARDRIGILPLHYMLTRDEILFSSEIKSLLIVPGVERSIDPVAMDQIFTFWTTLPGRTLFKNIDELPAGHCLTASNRGIAVRKYWEMPFSRPDEQETRPLDDVAAELRDLIRDAVRIRLRADVPVGCYLSGGLDSSGITSMVKKNFNNRVRSFGIGFDESDFDEGQFQKLMVDFLETEHTDIRASNDTIGEQFSRVLWHCEKPILRTAPVPLFLLSKAVSENGFKVVLTGEGADEIFAGYNIFREAKIRMFWARQPKSQCRPLLVGRLYPYIFKNNPRAKFVLHSFFGAGIEKTGDALYSHIIRWQNTARIKTFFSKELKAAIGDYQCYDDLRQRLPEGYTDWEPLARAQYLESIIFLGTYLLSSQGDRVSMAHGVEVRPPYLDHRIIEFMGRIPAKWKIRGLNEKYILKKTFQEIVPEQIIDRPKHPYRAPIRESLFQGMRAGHEQFLSDRSLQETGLFDLSKVRTFIHKVRQTPHVSEVEGMALAGILSSQIVARQFIEQFPSESIKPLDPDVLIDRRPGRASNFKYQKTNPQ